MRLLGTLVFLATASLCFGGEFAVLSTGSRIRVDRHESAGAKVRLYSGAGFIELEAAQVSGFEVFADPAPPAPAPPPAEPAAAPRHPRRARRNSPMPRPTDTDCRAGWCTA